jgi:hypothetical protein
MPNRDLSLCLVVAHVYLDASASHSKFEISPVKGVSFDSKFRISNFEFRISNFEYRISNFEFRISNFECETGEILHLRNFPLHSASSKCLNSNTCFRPLPRKLCSPRSPENDVVGLRAAVNGVLPHHQLVLGTTVREWRKALGDFLGSIGFPEPMSTDKLVVQYIFALNFGEGAVFPSDENAENGMLSLEPLLDLCIRATSAKAHDDTSLRKDYVWSMVLSFLTHVHRNR